MKLQNLLACHDYEYIDLVPGMKTILPYKSDGLQLSIENVEYLLGLVFLRQSSGQGFELSQFFSPVWDDAIPCVKALALAFRQMFLAPKTCYNYKCRGSKLKVSMQSSASLLCLPNFQ